MERYIDADELLARMKRTPRYFDVKHDIEAMPTADVVPRSEYDELLKAYSVYEEITGLKKAKHDVAREIFEEIERLIELTAFADCWSEGGFKSDIAELKKKYTGGNDENI